MNNQKGMSLIELLIAMCVTILVVFGVGYSILYYNGFFIVNEVRDFDKQITLGISKYIDDILTFASDVSIVNGEKAPTEDNDWHSLYVDNGALFHDDQLVFQKSYYDGNAISIKIRGFESSRMDFSYTLKNEKSEVLYETNNTLELFNLTSHVNNQQGYQPYASLITDYILLSKDDRIYYRKNLQ